MARFEKLRPGAKRLNSGDWNAAMDVARAFAQGQLNPRAALALATDPSSIVSVRNDTGGDLDRFGIVVLDDLIFTPTDDLQEFKNAFAFRGIAPTTAKLSPVAILQEPLANGTFGKGLVNGVSVCLLEVEHAAHTHAIASNAVVTKLASGMAGCAEILWKETGTGEKWAVVRTPGVAPGVLTVVLGAALNFGATATATVNTGPGTGSPVQVSMDLMASGETIAISTKGKVAWNGKYWDWIADRCVS